MLSPSRVVPSAVLCALLSAPLAAQRSSEAPSAPNPDTADVNAVPPAAAYTVDAHTGIRIVRLSLARGEVQLDHGIGTASERAFANLPIVSGAHLQTAEGIAEVEFEDNSTLRLAPQTRVQFSTLSRDRSGVTSTVVTVLQGTLFASLLKHDRNPLVLVAGSRTLTLRPGSHLRLQVDQPAFHLSVLDGDVEVQSSAGLTTVAKKHGLVSDPANPEIATLTGKETQQDGLSAWDKQSVEYHQASSNLAAFAGNGLYGANDLNYYGSFVDMPGCGSMWRPYFASANWSPFSVGAWSYYPGAGYSFVSPYPWGWTPFHTGAWQQCGNAGWGWSPRAEGGWSGLRNGSRIPATLTSKNPVLRPPMQPIHGSSGSLAVHTGPAPISAISAENTFIFARDSAGLGVPRQTFGNLRSASSLTVQHGTANIPVEVAGRPQAPGVGQGHVPASPTLTAIRPAGSAMLSPGTHPMPAGTSRDAAPGFSPGASSGGSRAPMAPSAGTSHGGAPAGGAASAGHNSK